MSERIKKFLELQRIEMVEKEFPQISQWGIDFETVVKFIPEARYWPVYSLDSESEVSDIRLSYLYPNCGHFLV